MRLIDAHGSYTINANDNTGYSIGFGGGIISVADEWGHIVAEFDADDAPTIDAVPVVRCRDCKHWNNACCGLGTGDCHVLERLTFETFFCSYGERKDGDG